MIHSSKNRKKPQIYRCLYLQGTLTTLISAETLIHALICILVVFSWTAAIKGALLGMLHINKEELIWDMKAGESPGCIDHQIRIPRGGSRAKTKTTASNLGNQIIFIAMLETDLISQSKVFVLYIIASYIIAL